MSTVAWVCITAVVIAAIFALAWCVVTVAREDARKADQTTTRPAPKWGKP